jgi:gliding motility-associated-like protein
MDNGNGCGTTDTLLVRVTDMNTPGHDPDIIVPTAFTPNGDGHNDLLTPIPVNLDHIALFRIFNRWGNVVFECFTAGKGWDGSFKGKPAPTETFTWIAEGVDHLGHSLRKQGVVTLIR